MTSIRENAEVMSTDPTTASPRMPWWLLLYYACVLLIGISLAIIIVHYLLTGDLLGFLPSHWRSIMEKHLALTPPPAGEGRIWQIDSRIHASTWLWLGMITCILAIVFWTAMTQRQKRIRYRIIQIISRLAIFAVVVGLMLPQWYLSIQNYSYPVVVLIFDRSQSMQAGPIQGEQINGQTRFAAARQHLFQRVLPELSKRHRHPVRIYTVGESVQYHGEAQPYEHAKISNILKSIQPQATASRLGNNLQQILDSTQAQAMIFWTDGIVTDGKRLQVVAREAKQRNIPLYMVGVGNSSNLRQLHLQDLRVNDNVFVQDTLIFEARVFARGYSRSEEAIQVNVQLFERGNSRPLATQTVTLHPNGLPVPIQFAYQPQEVGDKYYHLIASEQLQGTQVTRHFPKVTVLPIQPMKILYIEGYTRYEYRALRNLLERQLDPRTKKRVIDLDIILLESEDEYSGTDSAIRLHLPNAEELREYDVVIWGDVDLDRYAKRLPNHFLTSVKRYVQSDGGGFLMIAGARYGLQSYRNTPIEDILPVQIIPNQARDTTTNGQIPYLLRFTSRNMTVPLFGSWSLQRFQLPKLWWWAQSYYRRNESIALATHPNQPEQARKEGFEDIQRPLSNHPLILYWTPGAGRSLFAGIDETWRWNSDDFQIYYQQYWLQLLRHLARRDNQQIRLQLDRSAPYRNGESLKVRVQIPDHYLSKADRPWQAILQRSAPNSSIPIEIRTLPLQPVPEAWGLYQLQIDPLSVGNYRVWISLPEVHPNPSIEWQVISSPKEGERMIMNQKVLQAAAITSGGRFISLDEKGEILQHLPEGKPTPLGPVREIPIWNHLLIWGFALALLFGEWLLRRSMGEY